MTAPKIVRFYFDFVSPYSYLGWKELQKLCKEQPVPFEIQPVPIVLGALLNHWGNKGPSKIPPKQNFVFKDVLRRGKAMGLSLQLPPQHPFNPLLALRIVTVLKDSPRLSSIITSIFEACWVESQDITDRQVLGPILWAHGLNDGNNPIFEHATSNEIKEELKAHTNNAIELGVFGVPTYHVDDELFWGSDQVAFLRHYLLDPASV
jgi:2-hydroxychromene-2-carboxylate isomerase